MSVRTHTEWTHHDPNWNKTVTERVDIITFLHSGAAGYIGDYGQGHLYRGTAVAVVVTPDGEYRTAPVEELRRVADEEAK